VKKKFKLSKEMMSELFFFYEPSATSTLVAHFGQNVNSAESEKEHLLQLIASVR
jgi:hypothetical protein